jgi:integrase
MQNSPNPPSRRAVANDLRWAWPYVERAMKRVMPTELLFPDMNRWTAIKAGASLEHVARQLGHADTQMVVKVYGRYRPSETERLEWERIAELQDSERARSAQA